MFCVERNDGPDEWIEETSFQTDFKAFIHARTKSKARMMTYRVMFKSRSITGEVLRVRHGKSVDLSGEHFPIP